MCFSQGGSLTFLGLGLGTGLFLRSQGRPTRHYALFMYFALMELIQFLVSAWLQAHKQAACLLHSQADCTVCYPCPK